MLIETSGKELEVFEIKTITINDELFFDHDCLFYRIYH